MAFSYSNLESLIIILLGFFLPCHPIIFNALSPSASRKTISNLYIYKKSSLLLRGHKKTLRRLRRWMSIPWGWRGEETTVHPSSAIGLPGVWCVAVHCHWGKWPNLISCLRRCVFNNPAYTLELIVVLIREAHNHAPTPAPIFPLSRPQSMYNTFNCSHFERSGASLTRLGTAPLSISKLKTSSNQWPSKRTYTSPLFENKM